jgi:hypothetical protein
VLVRSTLYGDASLDGRVDGGDFARLASNFGKSGQSWVGGDFNYDSSVNGADFALLAANFGRAVPDGAGVAVTGEQWAALESFGSGIGVAVPEPAGLGIGLLAAPLALSRRRRRGCS